MSLYSNLTSQYSGARSVLGNYWRAYGGCTSALTSPYLHLSLVLCCCCYGTWSSEKWWEQPLTIVPGLLGFSLAGLALILGVGGERFRSLISGKRPGEQGESPYIQVTAAFSHFVVVQTLTVVLSLLCASLYRLELFTSVPELVELNRVARVSLWFVGYWLFLYSIFLAFASVFAVFNVATWFDYHSTLERKATSPSDGSIQLDSTPVHTSPVGEPIAKIIDRTSGE